MLSTHRSRHQRHAKAFPWTMALLAAAVPLSASAKDQMQVQTVTMQVPTAAGERPLKPIWADAMIRADGSVAEVRLDPTIAAPIAALLAKAIPGWRFQPAVKAGVPTDWATRITVALTAVPLEKGYALRVGRVSVSNIVENDARTWVPPAFPYPGHLAKKGDVTVHVLWKPGKGKTPSQILSTSVNGHDGKGDAFAISARNAVLQWRVIPVVWDGVEYPPDMICSPITFKDSRSEDDGGTALLAELDHLREVGAQGRDGLAAQPVIAAELDDDEVRIMSREQAR